MATISTWFRGAAALAALTLGLAAIGDEGKAIQERERGERATAADKIPAAVRATVARESQGGQVGNIVPALQNGATVYFVRYVVDGMWHAILLGADGSVIARRDEDDGGDDD